MNSASESQPILNEQALVITPWHLSVSGKRLSWADLGYVQIAKPAGWIVRLLTKEKPLYELRVARKGQPTSSAKAVFRTEDEELAKRIEAAINEVARKRGAARDF